MFRFISSLPQTTALLSILLPFCVQASPGTPMPISPADKAVNVGNTVTLNVDVPNSATNTVTVKYFGRVAPAGKDFTIVALPDTQYYTANIRGADMAMFTAQTDWIVSNRVSKNIAYVAGLGDIVEHGDSNRVPDNIAEWHKATNAWYRLEDPIKTQLPDGIPYGTAVGNHDQTPNGAPDGNSTYFNQYFGVSHFEGRSYYGGHYGTNNDNHLDFFSAGGIDFVAVYFEFDVKAASNVLAWANNVLQTNAHRRAIIVSHWIGGSTTPSKFSPQGALIYDALKGNPNLFLMLSGHVNGEGSRQDVFDGRTVTTLVSDYQFRTNGGNGFMRLMEFSPSNNVIRVSTYSPWANQFEKDADSAFEIPYAMQPASSEFRPVGTNNNVTPGTQSSVAWPDCTPGTAYEWYVTVSDGTRTVTSPTWKFTTSLTPGKSASSSPKLGSSETSRPTRRKGPARLTSGRP